MGGVCLMPSSTRASSCIGDVAYTASRRVGSCTCSTALSMPISSFRRFPILGAHHFRSGAQRPWTHAFRLLASSTPALHPRSTKGLWAAAKQPPHPPNSTAADVARKANGEAENRTTAIPSAPSLPFEAMPYGGGVVQAAGANRPSVRGKAEVLLSTLSSTMPREEPRDEESEHPKAENDDTHGQRKGGVGSTAVPPPASSSENDNAHEQRRVEQLREADTTMRVAERFASSRFREYIHTTEVASTSGMRWTDIYASPVFFEDPLMSRVPEGQFAYSVMRALFGARFPIGVYASVASGATLPAAYIDVNWACLILRPTKETLREVDGATGLLGSLRRRHRSERNAFNSADDHAALAEIVEREKVAHATDLDDEEGSHKGDPKEKRSTDTHSGLYPSTQYFIPEWPRRCFRRARWRWRSFWQGGAPSKASTLPDFAAQHRPGRASVSSGPRAPLTMSDFTDRLTIFVGKELHPIEEDPDAQDAAAIAAEVRSAPVLSLNMNRVYTCNSSADGVMPEHPASGVAKPKKKSTRYAVRWRVITVHRSPVSFIRDMQMQWNKLTSADGRSAVLQHAEPVDPNFAFTSSGQGRRAYASRDTQSAGVTTSGTVRLEVAAGEDSGLEDIYQPTVNRVEGWEDLVRLLYHGAAHTLQDSAFRNTHQLELMESEIFDTTGAAATPLRSMTRLLAELHLLSRRASIHNAILRESKVAYQKFKRCLDSSMTLMDHRELLYVDSVLSISAHIEEQSASLLYLQFSVAMNQTESHLRTLTIFSTFFIPLDFLSSCCGTNIASLGDYSHNRGVMWGVFGLMAGMAVVTQRWMRRKLR